MADERTVPVCPECGESRPLTKRQPGNGRDRVIGDPSDPWACHDCRISFEDPPQRDPDPRGKSPGASAKYGGLEWSDVAAE